MIGLIAWLTEKTGVGAFGLVIIYLVILGGCWPDSMVLLWVPLILIPLDILILAGKGAAAAGRAAVAGASKLAKKEPKPEKEKPLPPPPPPPSVREVISEAEKTYRDTISRLKSSSLLPDEKQLAMDYARATLAEKIRRAIDEH